MSTEKIRFSPAFRTVKISCVTPALSSSEPSQTTLRTKYGKRYKAVPMSNFTTPPQAGNISALLPEAWDINRLIQRYIHRLNGIPGRKIGRACDALRGLLLILRRNFVVKHGVMISFTSSGNLCQSFSPLSIVIAVASPNSFKLVFGFPDLE
jgi:hypothetical protein